MPSSASTLEVASSSVTSGSGVDVIYRTRSTTPRVGAIQDYPIDLASSYGTNCALHTSGTVKCWGHNYDGQAGSPGTTVLTPTPVDGVTSAVTLDMGAWGDSTCAVLATGRVQCWGNNYYGGFGNGGAGNNYYSAADAFTGITNNRDRCPRDPADQCGPIVSDSDKDGIEDANDNCSKRSNPGQGDLDGDGAGDACDADWDGDGADNGHDNCPLIVNADQADSDNDKIDDACDAVNGKETDRDGLADGEDNCKTVANRDQANHDTDVLGDLCDRDDDNDRVPDYRDNCQYTPNSRQQDANRDGRGDACQDRADDGPGTSTTVRARIAQSVAARAAARREA